MAALLLVLLVAVPFAEISVIVAVAQAIGGWATLGLLILGSVAGATLVRRQGRRAWNALRSAAEEGRPPDRAVADAGLTLVGGMLLFVPGFVTDVAGLALILPPTRRIGRVLVARGIRRRAAHGLAAAGTAASNTGRSNTGRSGAGQVITGEVIESRDEDAPTTRP